jgi:hypothetical protein
LAGIDFDKVAQFDIFSAATFALAGFFQGTLNYAYFFFGHGNASSLLGRKTPCGGMK